MKTWIVTTWAENSLRTLLCDTRDKAEASVLAIFHQAYGYPLDLPYDMAMMNHWANEVEVDILWDIQEIEIPEQPEIRRIWDISTAHVTEATGKIIQDVLDLEIYFPIPLYNKGEVGWLVYVPEDPAHSVGGYAHMPKDLLHVLVEAKNRNCDWVMFDRDGTVVDDLPSWSW